MSYEVQGYLSIFDLKKKKKVIGDVYSLAWSTFEVHLASLAIQDGCCTFGTAG